MNAHKLTLKCSYVCVIVYICAWFSKFFVYKVITGASAGHYGSRSQCLARVVSRCVGASCSCAHIAAYNKSEKLQGN